MIIWVRVLYVKVNLDSLSLVFVVNALTFSERP
jgi:hypothetical protein